jgi:hypothetical protein
MAVAVRGNQRQSDGNQMAIRWQSDGNQMAIRWQSDGNQMAMSGDQRQFVVIKRPSRGDHEAIMSTLV